jgi:hypothetical protein
MTKRKKKLSEPRPPFGGLFYGELMIDFNKDFGPYYDKENYIASKKSVDVVEVLSAAYKTYCLYCSSIPHILYVGIQERDGVIQCSRCERKWKKNGRPEKV